VTLKDGTIIKEGEKKLSSLDYNLIKSLRILRNNKIILELENGEKNKLFYQKVCTVDIFNRRQKLEEEAGILIDSDTNKFRVFLITPEGDIKEKIEEKDEVFLRIHQIETFNETLWIIREGSI